MDAPKQIDQPASSEVGEQMLVRRCDGTCHSSGKCKGDVHTYEIVSHASGMSAFIGMRFNYCTTAFLEDRSKGFFMNLVDNAD